MNAKLAVDLDVNPTRGAPGSPQEFNLRIQNRSQGDVFVEEVLLTDGWFPAQLLLVPPFGVVVPAGGQVHFKLRCAAHAKPPTGGTGEVRATASALVFSDEGRIYSPKATYVVEF
jgi:hypothetical protein